MKHYLVRSLEKLTRERLLIFLLAIFGIILLTLGVKTQPDSGSYLHNSSVRSMLYPLILKIYILFFKTNFIYLIFMQILLGILACYNFSKSFADYFNLPYLKFKIFRIVALILLLSPYWGMLKIGNNIMSEAICYPLFLFAINNFISVLINSNYKKFFKFLWFTCLLILARRQFLFIYPVTVVFIIYLFWLKKFNKSKLISITLAFLLSIVVTDLLERSYHYIYHNRFSHVPFTGIQLIVAPMYVAKSQDINLFTNKIEQQIFKEINENIEKNILSQLSEFNRKNCFFYYHFYNYYNTMHHGIIPAAFSKNNISDPWKLDKIAIKMSLVLIINNLKNYLFLYILNIILNLGGFFFVMLLSFLFLYTLFWQIKFKDNLSLITIAILMFSFANYGLVALVETAFNRYTHYTDTILMLVLFTHIASLWKIKHDICCNTSI
jgi:hypothetical protein